MILLVCIYLIVPFNGFSQENTKQENDKPVASNIVTGYIHDSWGTGNDVIGNFFENIFQTADGHLLFTNIGGLFRFDGKQFDQYESWNFQYSSNNYIQKIFEDSRGNIWVGTHVRGLVQIRDRRIIPYTVSEGLVSNLISDITEDAEGNIWVGTYEGLNRISNGKLTTFTTENGLTANTISAFHHDGDGNLWVGTTNGLNRIENGKPVAISDQPGLTDEIITVFYEDGENGIWIGSAGGLNLYKEGKWSYFSTEQGLANNFISCMTRDSKGNLWIGTNGGLTRLKDNNWESYTTKQGLRSNSIHGILEDNDSGIWVVTENESIGGTLNRFEGERFRAYGTGDGLFNESISELFKDDDGNMWIGTYSGLNLFSDGRLLSFPQIEGLGGSQVASIIQDHEGHIWVGTASGLFRFRKRGITTLTKAEGLSGDRVSAVLQDKNGNWWIATDGNGLNYIKDGKTTQFKTADGLSNNRVTALCEGRNGTLWIGTRTGLNRLKDGRITSLSPEKGWENDVIRVIYQDRSGKLWIGSQSGLRKLETGRLKRVKTGENINPAPVRAITETVDGKLLVGTWGNGLLILENGTFTTVTTKDGLTGNRISCLYVDGEENLWLGIDDGGLNRIKTGNLDSDPDIDTVTAQQGLYLDSVFSIIEDDGNNLWMGSAAGIFRIGKQDLEDYFGGNRRRVRSVPYNQSDGMKSSQCMSGTFPGAVKSRDGKLWFATENGAAVLNPAVINHHPLLLRIKEINMDGLTIHAPVSKKGKPIEFPPGQGRFEVHYSGVSLYKPDNVQFKTRLEGIDLRWQDVGERRSVNYGNLPPGNYTFMVKACNSDGKWFEDHASFSFYLKPYYYNTTWFRVLLGAFVLLLAFFGYRYRVRHLKARERELAMLVEERTRELKEKSEKLKEMDNIKSRFFANISHEFRTPLTLIIGPLEQMINDCPDHASERKRELTLVLRNAQRLLRLINQLLELSKLESGKMKLEARRVNVSEFIKGMISSFGLLARQKELKLLYRPFGEDGSADGEMGENDVHAYIDVRKMEDVFSNLLVNALKFTPPGGQVIVSLQPHGGSVEGFPDGWFEVVVSDTGPGIPSSELAHIFDRFYQADSTHEHHQKGSGIGLALCRELVELHHGVIVAGNRDGGGSMFTFRIPLGKKHLEPMEILDGKADGQPEVGPDRIEVPGSTFPPGEDIESRESDEPGDHFLESVRADETDIILVVEDSSDLRDYIRGMLQPMYTVVEAVNGKEGIQKARDVIPDLIVSDLMMPEADGYELCRELKGHVDTSHIPIILLTAKASEGSVVEGLESGADDYVTKPFNTNILLARITSLIKLRQQLRKTVNPETTVKPVRVELSGLDKEFVKELKTVIDSNLSDPELNVEELSKRLYMGRTTLYRKIQALSGETPTEFIRSYRLKRAAELLKEDYDTILDVAMSVGFSSANYFTKCFKKKFNQLPSEYQG